MKAASTIAQNVTIVNCWFDWLTREGVVRTNPTRRNGERILSRPRIGKPEENDNVLTVTGADMQLILEAAEFAPWNERIAVNVGAYTGFRRAAIAKARHRDYDAKARTLELEEKGGKRIRKPVPDKLAELLDAAIAAGVYESDDDYLIPSDSQQRRQGERDARVIWRLVRKAAARAGVDCHVHALRAAFAVQYLETGLGDTDMLQDLMGHARGETTQVYLRRLNRHKRMESVRDLDWGSPPEAVNL